MATFEVIMLCLLIPILYVVVYMAGRCDVIGTFLKMSMEAIDTKVDEFEKMEKELDRIEKMVDEEDEIDDELREMYERIEYLISQFEEAREYAEMKASSDLTFRAKADVLDDIINILEEELLEEKVEESGDE